jgi:hypothetical protein
MPTATTTKPHTKKSKVPQEVVYPQLRIVACVNNDTPTAPGTERWPAMTVERIKELLGWEAEVKDGPEKITFADCLFRDYEGNGVRLLNNAHNREFDLEHAKRLAHEQLNKHWSMNGETIIFGKYGNCISGQHRGASLPLAEQLRTSDKLEGMPNRVKSQRGHWEDMGWDKPVTMECLLVFGVDESPNTLRTLDNVKTRTDYDVLCSLDYFASLKPKPRKTAVKALAFAIKLLWERAGYGDEKWNAYSPYRTHAESLDLLRRHKKIEACVKHILLNDGDDEKFISHYLPLGMAAGCMYLMAASATDINTYRLADPPSEKKINFAHLEKAEQFWTDLSCTGDGPCQPLRQYITELRKERGDAGITRRETMAIFAKAWVAYLGGNMQRDDLVLEFSTNDDGEQVLIGHPVFGGIDVEEDDDGTAPPAPDEIVANGAEERKAKAVKKAKPTAPTTPPLAEVEPFNGNGQLAPELQAEADRRRTLVEANQPPAPAAPAELFGDEPTPLEGISDAPVTEPTAAALSVEPDKKSPPIPRKKK